MAKSSQYRFLARVLRALIALAGFDALLDKPSQWLSGPDTMRGWFSDSLKS